MTPLVTRVRSVCASPAAVPIVSEGAGATRRKSGKSLEYRTYSTIRTPELSRTWGVGCESAVPWVRNRPHAKATPSVRERCVATGLRELCSDVHFFSERRMQIDPRAINEIVVKVQ
jgi:hypothetical protein